MILSGRGRAEIADDIVEAGPGDITGFPAPDGPAHHLTNPFDEDLVYLMGAKALILMSRISQESEGTWCSLNPEYCRSPITTLSG